MIWILVFDDKMQSFENQLIKNNIGNKDIIMLDPMKINISIIDDKIKYFYSGSEIFVPSKVWCKVGCMINNQIVDLLDTLKSDGVKLINEIIPLKVSANKFSSSLILQRNNISTINTFKVQDSQNIVMENPFGYPVIIKSKFGSLGKGIYKICSKEELKNIVEQIDLLDENYEYLLQEYIPEARDTYRVIMLGSQIKYIIKYSAKEFEFKSNYIKNDQAEITRANEGMINICDQIYNVVNLNIMGIDLIKMSDGTYKVCEINSNPGFMYLKTKKNVDFEIDLIDYIKNF